MTRRPRRNHAAAYKAKVALAADLTQSSTDSKQLLPMLAQIKKNLAQKPAKASADAGYFSEANVTDEAVTKIDLYIATGRDRHVAPGRQQSAMCLLVRLDGNRCGIS